MILKIKIKETDLDLMKPFDVMDKVITGKISTIKAYRAYEKSLTDLTENKIKHKRLLNNFYKFKDLADTQYDKYKW